MGRYFGRLAYAWQMSGIFGWLLIGSWCVSPFVVHAVIYPSRALNFQNWMQGRSIEQFFTSQAMHAGEVTAVLALATVCLFQLGVTVMLYRRTQAFVPTWPVGLLLIAGMANLIWWIQTGFFDPQGALIGATPMASGVLWQTVCEKWGADFVFGKGNRPDPLPGLGY